MINYEELATAVDEMREALRVMVAGLMADGFTDEQAREIVVSIMRMSQPDDQEEVPEGYSCHCQGDPLHPNSERCGP